MRLILLTFALFASSALAQAVPPARPAPARARVSAHTTPAEAAARKALAGVVTRYRTLKSYRLQGEFSNEVGSSQGMTHTVNSVRFVVQRPGHLVTEAHNDQASNRMVADGESLWTSMPELSQYQVQSLDAVRAGSDSAAFERQFDPAGGYAHVLEGVTSVRSLGKDTVITARGAVTCERYALTSDNSEAEAQGVKMFPHVLWVDPATHMVLLDSMRVEQNHPQLGQVYSINISRMVVAEADPVLAADTFRFHSQGDLRRVRRFMRSSPEHTAMEGQPAQDFTLETLAEAKPVRLSELKGKVVVLDFWATWCGPCRRWLPIVAKAHRDYADKGLIVYAVNERETEPKVREYLEKQKLDVPVLMDRSGKVGTDYHASAIPLTVVVGRDGKVFRVMVGLHEEDDLRDVLHEAGID